MTGKGHIELLIAIDDTDNADSRGTGYHARQLAHALEASKLAMVRGITRHQLFVDPAIRYTSQNSSACINISTMNVNEVKKVCEAYLLQNSAPGSDAGLCIGQSKEVSEEVMDWGRRAKNTILYMDNAFELAGKEGIFLKGYTGNHEGIIGALAAVGLHACGSDGRYIWRRGIKELRDMETGIFDTRRIKDELGLDEIASLDGEQAKDTDRILISEWVRPIRKDHKAILITQKNEKHDEYEWELTGKEVIRSIT